MQIYGGQKANRDSYDKMKTKSGKDMLRTWEATKTDVKQSESTTIRMNSQFLVYNYFSV